MEVSMKKEKWKNDFGVLSFFFFLSLLTASALAAEEQAAQEQPVTEQAAQEEAAIEQVAAEQAVTEQPANKSSLRLSLGASLGFLHGQGEEIVYRDTATNNKLSQLLWDIKPLGYAGVDVGLDWQRPASRWGFFADGNFKFGFPGKSGVMQDSDWTVAAYPDWLTYYSVSDNRTKSAILIDAATGASFRLSKLFVLKAYIAYNFIRFSWTASGGSFLYPGDNGHFYINMNPRDVGNYSQTWHIIAPASAFYGKFNRYFDVELSFALSPFIFSSAVDNHLLRSLDIFFDMKGGIFIEPKLAFSYTPKDYFSLSLSASYRNISGTRGDGKYVQKGEGTMTIHNRVGAGYEAFDVALIAKFSVDILRIWQTKK
jgi:outer membrane protease